MQRIFQSTSPWSIRHKLPRMCTFRIVPTGIGSELTSIRSRGSPSPFKPFSSFQKFYSPDEYFNSGSSKVYGKNP